MQAIENIVFMYGWGPEEEGRASSLLHIVGTAVAMGLDVRVFLFTDGVLMAKRGTADKVSQNLGQRLKDALADRRVKVYACEEAARARGLSRGDFEPNVSIIGYATFLDIALSAKTVITI